MEFKLALAATGQLAESAPFPRNPAAAGGLVADH